MNEFFVKPSLDPVPQDVEELRRDFFFFTIKKSDNGWTPADLGPHNIAFQHVGQQAWCLYNGNPSIIFGQSNICNLRYRWLISPFQGSQLVPYEAYFDDLDQEIQGSHDMLAGKLVDLTQGFAPCHLPRDQISPYYFWRCTTAARETDSAASYIQANHISLLRKRYDLLLEEFARFAQQTCGLAIPPRIKQGPGCAAFRQGNGC